MKTVMSVGGSIVVPDNLDVDFLKNFRKLILESEGQFIIIVGGGKTCRNYQNAAKQVIKLHKEDLDWLGIHSTRLNAHLLRTIFREHAYPRIITDPNEYIDFEEKILIAAGWKPGWSTDYCAVLLGEKHNAKAVLNLTNVDYVYDKNPKKYPDAEPIKKISWNDFREIVGDVWRPGLNAPFDPIASREAQEAGIKVVIMNGKNTKNLRNYLEGEKFEGTIIE